MLTPLTIWVKRHKKTSAVLLLLAAVVLYRLAGGGGQGPPPPEAAPAYVLLGQARHGTMREIGRYYGSLAAASRFSVAPRVGGQLKELLVDIGDRVENGRLVARLDDESFTLLRDQAESAVAVHLAQHEEAAANLDLARSDLERQRSLARKNIVTQSDFETVENRLRQAEARLAVAESQLRNARSVLADAELQLSYTRVTADWPSGQARYVGERLADEGDLVLPNAPLVTVVALDPLIVVVEVTERDYPKIRPGQTAGLRVEAWPGQSFNGRVLRVAPVLSADSRQARVELEVENPDLRLKPGMFAEVEFVFEEHPDVWSVPQDVPFRRAEGFVIFVADPRTQTVRQAPVTLGLVENGQVELVGIETIDGPVVFLGQHLLSDGGAYLQPAEAGGETPTAPPETP